jgi:hypothetical protein
MLCFLNPGAARAPTRGRGEGLAGRSMWQLNIRWRHVNWVTERDPPMIYIRPMPYLTDAELAEIVPDLRAMAAIEASAEVRDAANRLAERYTAMAAAAQIAERGAVRELAQA